MASATNVLALRPAVTREVLDEGVEEKLMKAERIELPSDHSFHELIDPAVAKSVMIVAIAVRTRPIPKFH
jgi:hypothetical protein